MNLGYIFSNFNKILVKYKRGKIGCIQNIIHITMDRNNLYYKKKIMSPTKEFTLSNFW